MAYRRVDRQDEGTGEWTQVAFLDLRIGDFFRLDDDESEPKNEDGRTIYVAIGNPYAIGDDNFGIEADVINQES